MYDKFEEENDWMGYGDCICNGCGKRLNALEKRDHYDQCEISKLRVILDKKSHGKATFTKVRENEK